MEKRIFRIMAMALYFGFLAIPSIQGKEYVSNELKIKNEPSENATEVFEIDRECLTDTYRVIEIEDAYVMTEDDLEEEMYFDSLELLAICVEAEAGNQDLKGKRLVVDVILNRVDSDLFPDDIVSVISQMGQFSSFTNGGMESVIEPSEETFDAVRLELDARLDSKILFFTAGYYNTSCQPAYKYGDHYFGY